MGKKNSWAVLAILALELLALRLLAPYLVTGPALVSMGRQLAVTGVVAVGMGIILLGGGMDLSLGAIVALTGMVAAELMAQGVPVLPAAALCVLLGLLLGWINGMVTAKVRIHPFILTMALGVVYRGLGKMVHKGMPIYNLPEALHRFDRGTFLEIPWTVWIFLLCVGLGTFLLSKTYLGKYIYALGADGKAARLAGVDTVRVQWIVYGLGGFFAGVASMLLLSRVGSAQPGAATGVELDVLVGAALGGVSFKGGRGLLLHMILGIFILEVLGNALLLLSVGEYYRNLLKGAILLGALALDSANKEE
ncbi:ABC transporter permease [Anaerotalea alkaliphila]|uniref:ABC transporter permease n=1 Tax=Anaerotalea alkaliphila TaxID=2662126 RepID=A0A7X5HY05_9FIRM|nr:ABC transporter permease [Anaerotalea alkaliphila]NDL68693.1 ABC transporter permease [Anaerotalea alkaliphila]